jgi:hypothetical protein
VNHKIWAPTLVVWRAITSDLDLYALVFAGFVFALLGVFGIADEKTLASVILAFLTLMAFSLARMRAAGRAGNAARIGELFWTEFPSELYDRRASADRQYLYIGMSGYRTIGTGMADFRRILEKGGAVQILLLNPENAPLLEFACSRGRMEQTVSQLRSRVQASLAELSVLGNESGLEVRLSDIIPSFGVNAADMDSSAGAIYIQHYEYLAATESGPIYKIEAQDLFWYQRQLAELNRMWEAGIKYAFPED